MTSGGAGCPGVKCGQRFVEFERKVAMPFITKDPTALVQSLNDWFWKIQLRMYIITLKIIKCTPVIEFLLSYSQRYRYVSEATLHRKSYIAELGRDTVRSKQFSLLEPSDG